MSRFKIRAFPPDGASNDVWVSIVVDIAYRGTFRDVFFLQLGLREGDLGAQCGAECNGDKEGVW